VSSIPDLFAFPHAHQTLARAKVPRYTRAALTISCSAVHRAVDPLSPGGNGSSSASAARRIHL